MLLMGTSLFVICKFYKTLEPPGKSLLSKSDFYFILFLSIKMTSTSDAKRAEAVQQALFSILKGSRPGKDDQNYTHNAQSLPKGKFRIDNKNLYSYYSSL